MEEKIKELIKEFCEESDYELYENYSGRFMYGRQCIGIVTDAGPLGLMYDLTAYIFENLDEDDFEMYNQDIREFIGNASMDHMGLSMIVYFPNIEC